MTRNPDAMPPSQTPAGEKMRKQLVELVGKLQDEEHAHVKAQNELPTLDDGALKAAVAHKESTERVADLKSKLSVLQGIIKQRRPVLAKVASSPFSGCESSRGSPMFLLTRQQSGGSVRLGGGCADAWPAAHRRTPSLG